MSKEHKHKIKLAFNDDEIISYCEECGKILDVYKRITPKETIIYKPYPYYVYQTYPQWTWSSGTTSLNGTSTSTTVESATLPTYSTKEGD